MPSVRAAKSSASKLRNKWIRWSWAGGLLVVLFFTPYCSDAPPAETTAPTSAQPPNGRELAAAYCANCHLYPEPKLLDRTTWRDYILPRMGALLGIYRDGYGYYDRVPDHWLEPGPGGQRILTANIYPPEPLLSRPEWEAIADYYLAEAPEQLESASADLEISVGIPFMKARTFAEGNVLPPLIQGMGVDEAQKRIYVSVFEEGIWQFDFRGRLLDRSETSALVPSFTVDQAHFALVDMGTRLASDHPQGSLQIASSWSAYRAGRSQQLPDLMRPVHLRRGDLNGDQRPDYLVCEYGNMLGRLAWWEAKADGSFQAHNLYPDDGAVRTEIVDYDGDGDPDVLALQANSDEGIDLYLNEGQGQFERQRLLRFLSTNGSTHFESLDFEGDGQLDLLVCNGDNGDYPPILKPHHGIRLYQRQGERYQERFFLPLNGVYQATARDFDLDGDLDIAAVSFHPDFERHPQESFVLFIQEAPYEFRAFTIPQYGYSRWMRLQCFDWDADGDPDLLLSAFNAKTPDVPERRARDWEMTGEALLLLENTTR